MKDDFVSASELARLGYCERQVAFDAAYGRRTTARQRQAAARGKRAHDDFLQESRRIARVSERKGRCFIATLALGECRETTALRQYRDLFFVVMGGKAVHRCLLPRLSIVCRLMEGRPALLWLCRGPLRALGTYARNAVSRRLEQPGSGDER